MLTLSRWLADSNRRKRFCRPVTKPLIQTTRRIPLLNSSAKLQQNFIPPNVSTVFFEIFFSPPYSNKWNIL